MIPRDPKACEELMQLGCNVFPIAETVEVNGR
jgi:hypothetical protein